MTDVDDDRGRRRRSDCRAARLLVPYAEDPPPGLYRSTRSDLIIRLAGTALCHFVSAVMRLGGDQPLPEPVEASNRKAVTVAGRRDVARDRSVVELTLTPDGDATLDPWHPGAHIDVRLPSGRVRQYSLCGDPARVDQYRIAARRLPGGSGGSMELHELDVGQSIEITGPRNAFMMPVPGSGSAAAKLRFIAGGIGITPILPMVRLAERLGIPWSLYYVGRHRDSLPFLPELVPWADKVRVRTTDDAGRPTTAELLDGVDDQTALYLCGPPTMVAAVRRDIRPGSVKELHVELFSPLPIIDGLPFEVALARSSRTVQVGARQSTLTALLQVEPDVGYSCRQGFCGSCVQRVLAGDVDHRDTLLSEEQRALGQMLVCVSRAKSGTGALILDL